MDNILGIKLVSFRDLGVSRITAVKISALFKKLGTCGTVDRTVYSASAEKRIISGVNDRVALESRYISLNDKKRHILSLRVDTCISADTCELGRTRESVEDFCS